MVQTLQTPVRQSLDVSLRPARDVAEDAEAFCTLSNSLYSRKVNREYYRWQFFQTPFPTVLTFATGPDKQLAGCYGIQVRDSSLGKQSIAMALDIMVAPVFQGTGVFRKLADCALAQVRRYQPALVYVMANERANAAHVQGLGWRSIRVFNDYVRPTAQAAKQAPDHIRATPVRKFTTEDRAFLANVAGSAQEQQIRLSRAAQDLQWRLLDNPLHTYEFLRCTAFGECLGFIALKAFRDPLTAAVYGDIVDVILCKDHPAIASDLLTVALGQFERQGIEQATIWLADNSAVEVAGRALGFRQVTRPRYLSARLLGEGPSWAMDSNRWCVTMLDTDIY